MTPDGGSVALTEEKKVDVLKVVDDYSGQALRVLAVAMRPMDAMPFSLQDDDEDESISTDGKFDICRQDLQLVGLVASIDPAREGVQKAVETAHGAGIRVVMITGDYLKTAVAIAKNVGILTPEDDESIGAVDCKRLRPGADEAYLGNNEIDALTACTKVFARAKPEDKLEIVRSLQRQHLVSAMTGDGVNDAPALNQADIGVAMGIQGTEVAKGAADMILTDDNFCSIVTAIEKGRVIYAGIQKFVAFIMSVHIAEVLQIFLCVVLGLPVMRNPLQILFLILVTDLPPSIALGMEPSDKSILEQPPRPKKEPIVLGWMWLSICMNGAILAAVILGIYCYSLHVFCEGHLLQDDIILLPNYEEKLMGARTVAFIALVFSENIRAYTSRSFDRPFWQNLWSNVYMQYAVVLAQLSLWAAVLIPGLSDQILSLDGTSIGWFGLALAFAGPAGTLVLCEAAKVITHYQVQAYQARLRKNQGGEEAARAHSTSKRSRRIEVQVTDTSEAVRQLSDICL